MIKANKSNFT